MRPVIEVLGEEFPLIISPTRLQHAACPLSFKLTYLDRTVPRYRRPAAARGIVAHHAVALLTARCLDAVILPNQLTDDDLRDAIARAASHDVYPELGSIYDWLSLWRERFALRPRELVGYEERIAIDERFQWTSWDDASFRGIVDVVHLARRMRTAIVTDYKSMPNLLSHAALVEHEQGSFYCWLVSKFYPQVEDFIFRVWYLRYGCYVETMRTRRQLEHFEQAMLIKRQMITEITEWKPIAGRHCGVCDFVHVCPLANDDSALPDELVSDEQAVRVAGELRAKEEWVKEARTKLKTYVTHNDEVRLPGYAYGFRAPTAGGKSEFRGHSTAAAQPAGGEEGEPA